MTVKTIGPAGDFTSITAALANLQTTPATDALVWELQSAYVSSVETFPISFTVVNLNGITITNTLTIRPETGATGLVITSGAAQTIFLNGAHDVIFDGRPGGTGTVSQLKITNTSTTFGFYPVQLTNATRNVIEYCDVTSSNSSQLVSPWTGRGAAIYFTSGNSNNTIDNCSIHGIANDAAGIANNLIYAANTSTSTTITNNNFYDYGTKGTVGAHAIYLSNCTGSVITGNSFYQTAARTVQYGTYGVYINAGDNYTVSGNFFGGTAPLCSGTPMILNQTYNYEFYGAISISAGTTTASNVQGNTIQNIQVNHTTNTSSSGIQAMITLAGGLVNAGTVTPNLIGSETVASSITFNQNYNGTGTVYGINISGTGTRNVSNNIICGIGITSTISQRGINFSGIGNGAAGTTISGNTIGSTTLANAIINSSSGTLYGIYTMGGTPVISGNTVSNLTHSGSGLNSAQIAGITGNGFSGVTMTVTGNTIQNLTSSSTATTNGSASCIVGISASFNTAPITISNNIIRGLANTDPAAAVNITGIFYQGPTTGTNVVSRNFIHSFGLSSSSTSAGMTGIYANTGTTAFQNNMIRLGIDAAGSGINTGYAIYGIYDAAGTNNYYFNSIYIGGAGVTGSTSSTYAFNSAAVGTTRIIQNNIFANARSGGSSGKHYAIAIAGTAPLPAGVTSGYNILYAPGTMGGNTGYYNGAAQLTISDWRTASGLDLTSGAGDPSFTAPAGSSATVDLHVNSSTPVEAAGLSVASVTDDYDGQARASLTPTDIGADAGNFTNSGDIFPPAITFTPLGNTPSTANLTLANFAAISDNIAVSGGLNLPRIYYKKATDADAFAGNTSSDNGWKYTVATNSTSPYSFIIDYSIINGGSVTPGVTIQYFIVAQDNANNLSSKAGGATSGSATDPVQNINGAPLTANLNSYVIINNNIGGTITIPGDYPSLTGVGGLFSAINLGTVTGNMNVVIAGNLTEDGTYALNQWTENPVASNFTMSISPGDATLKTITGTLNNGLIRFNGADRVTIDGRSGGTGSYLEFENSNTGTSSSAFTFLADATLNTLKYIGIKGANPAATGGVVLFSTGTTTGNDNNTLDHCDIHDGAGLPANLVYSAGTATSAVLCNSGIVVSNCNLYNWYSPTVNSYGVSLITGNTDWTITGNSFYQTAARNLGSFTTGAISIANTTYGNNFAVTNNYVGGDSPLAIVTGNPMTFTGTGLFQGIGLSVATATASSVQGNTIRNISLSTGSSSALQAAILLGAGAISCGNTTPNTIGSTTAANSIDIVNTGTSTAQVFSGILAGTGTPGTINISNNVVCGIAISGTSTGTTGLRGIAFQGTGGPYTVSGNMIGSLTLANALSNSTAQAVYGIFNSSVTGAVTISGNTIANLAQTNTGAATNQLFGISKQGSATAAISGNTVSNLVSSSAIVSNGSAAALIGISLTAGTTTLTQNTVHSLSSIAATAAVNVIGIYSSASGTISRNFVHSNSLSSSATDAGMTGIYAGGSSTYQNNMVRLGIDGTGADISTGYSICGIYDGAGTNNVYFNSVYIGGSAVTGTTSPTYAFNSITTGTRIFQNNIFVNARSGGSNLGAGINHYAIKLGGTTYNPTGLTSGYNLLYAPGTGGMTGYFNLTDYPTLAGLQGATGQDLTSGYGDPSFIAPAGTNATVNLHVNSTSPVEAAGLPVGSVTDDFDGSLRSGLTPTDIGADAGNFTNSPDVFAPVITFTPIQNTALLANRVLTGFATITDNVGVSASPNAPRIYYKKSTDANAFAGNTSSDNGWKYTVATNSVSPYDFVIDYSIINGGSVVSGDVVQYFIVAQDDANNLGSKAPGATAGTTPAIQNITAAPALGVINSYQILNSISGIYTVGGAGANYTTLTASDGAFAAINLSNTTAAKVTGNITIVMTGNTTEPGTVALNQWTEEPAGSNFTVTIQPDAATMRSATGSLATPLFRLDGADRVTIDGRSGGSGRYLTFSNTFTSTGATSATFALSNGATNNVFQYCVIQGGAISTTSGVVFFGTTSNTTGNTSNLIDNCEIRDVGGVTRTANMIYSSGHATYKNLANTISNCEISNFENSGIKLALNSNDWTISGNSFFYNKATTSIGVMRVLDIASGNIVVSGNYIGGQAPLCGGGFFVSGPFSAIYNNMAGTANSYQGNTIQNITVNGGASQVKIFYGYTGPVNIGNVTGNTIGHPTTPNSIVINTTSGYNNVIYYQTTGANVVNNTIANIVFNPATGANNAVIEMNYGGPNVIKDNVIHDITCSGTAGATDATAALTGISAPMYATGVTIESNSIYNLSTTNVASTSAITVQGIYLEASYSLTTPTVVLRNSVYNLTTANTGGNANIFGIHTKGGNMSIYNNLVSLGTGVSSPANLYGLYAESGNTRWWFNSVNIVGTATSGSNPTHAFYRSSATTTLKDNILSNSRTGGAGVHSAIRVNPTTGTFYSNYNDLYASGATLGYWGAAGLANLAAWKAVSSKDTSSVSADPQFVSATDLHSTKPELNNSGIAVTGITTDYANVVRNVPPDIGAYEFTAPFTSINTLAATSIGQTTATLNGDINSGNEIVSMSFEYGLTTAYGITAAGVPPTVRSLTSVAVSAPVASLAPNTLYHYRIKGASTTSAEVAYGLDMTFVTLPMPTITPSADPICIHSSVTYTTEPGNSTYIWNVSAGGSITAGGTTADNYVTVLWNAGGTQSVTVNYNNSAGSPAPSPTVFNVTFKTATTPTLTGPASVCEGTTDVVYTTESGMSNYLWTVTGGVVTAGGTAADNSVTVTWSTPATGHVIVDYAGANGCTAANPTDLPVTVHALPVPVVTGPSSACVNSTGNVYSTTAGMTGYSWNVSVGGTVTSGGTSTDNSVTVTWNTEGAQSVSVSYTDIYGCVPLNPTAYPVTVKPILPVSVNISALPAGTICSGTSVTFTATPLNGGTSPAYQWYNGITPVGTDNPVYTSGTLANGDIITVVLTSSEQCQSGGPATSNPITMNVLPALVSGTAGSNQTVCYATPASAISATVATGGSGGPYLYQWQSSPDGVSNWTDITGETSLTYAPGVMFATGWFRIQSTDGGSPPTCGTVTSNVVTVTVNDPISAPVLSANQTICNGTSPAQLSATTATGGTGPFNYQWQMKTTGSWSNVGTNSLTYQPPALFQTTQYRVIASDAGNPYCGSTISNVITVTVQDVPGAGSIASDQTICSGTAPAALTSTGAGTGSGTLSYLWESSVDAGATWTPITGANSSGYTPGTLTQTTMYHRITVSTLNAVDCQSAPTNPVTITVNSSATADFSASNLTPPKFTDVTLTDLSTGTATSWFWSFSPAMVVFVNGTSATSQNPVVQFTEGGLYSVTLTVNGATCPNTLTKTNYINAGILGLWAGTVSTDWTDPLNWDNHFTPDVNTDVIVPSAAPNWPVFSGTLTVGTTCKSITLTNVASDLTITGDLVILNGFSIDNSGTIHLQGNLDNQNTN